MRYRPKDVLLVSCLLATMELRSSGDRKKIISTPDKPTRVFIGENVSLVWRYYHPPRVTLSEVVFGIRKGVDNLKPKLLAVNRNGFLTVEKGYESKVSWAGNLTSSLAVFVLHHVQPADGKKVFGITLDFGLLYNQLHDSVQLQVEAKPIADLPRITYVTILPLLQIGQNFSLNCTATGLFPVNVTWYKENKVLASGISEAVFSRRNITDKDWGEFVCVAKNSAGEDKKNVTLKVLPKSPTILNANMTVRNASWTLRWSAVYSEGQKVKLYTVWHQVVNVTNHNTTLDKPWSRKNVTGLMYHKELTANTSYMFAVTAWNRWGESVLETDKILSISTDFSVSTEPGTSILPSDSDKKWDFTRKTEAILYGVMAAALCILFLVVVVNYYIRKRRNRVKQNNKRHTEMRGVTPCSFTPQENITSEVAQETTNETGSVIIAGSSPSVSEPSLISEQPTASIRNLQRDYNQPRSGKCFVLTAFQPKMTTTSPSSRPHELPSTLETFVPHSGGEISKQGQDIHVAVIKRVTLEQHGNITMETDDATAVVATVNDRSIQQRNQDLRKLQAVETLRQNGNVTDTFQRLTISGDYLQPVDNKSSVQAAVGNTNSSSLCRKKAKTFSPNHPQAKPRVKILGQRGSKKLFQGKHSALTGNNPLYEHDEREAIQHCSSVQPADQPNQPIPQTKTRHYQHSYQNDRGTMIPYQNALRPAGSVESPYMRVLSNTNWEVSRDHLFLFERIGGGSFGQVWKGAVFGLAGDQEWSDVAVKMLKENFSNSDLKDLLSELDLLKKLKPHPNVIQLLGCLTKNVIRCKGGHEFRPPLVILEFVPHGDLLGYLKKSKGETDDYYNLKSAEVPRKIPTQQLYKFASDIARGMEFISAQQLIHRDLAARNVLVGKGLRCKITDFGMARDLGKAEMYVRRSNGLMPLKWMAVESFKYQVFTTESDVWSYGIVLYEIFTLGGRPYEGMTGEEVYNYVANGGRLPKTSAMSSELYNLMLQCWHEDPFKRPTFGSITSWTETLVQDY